MVNDGMETFDHGGFPFGVSTADVEMVEAVDEGEGIDADETLVENDPDGVMEDAPSNAEDNDTDMDDGPSKGEKNDTDTDMDDGPSNAADEGGGGYDNDDNDDDGDYEPEADQSGDRTDAPRAKWSEEMVQTQEMMRLGLCVNTAVRVAICLGCRSVIKPSDLYTHITKAHSISTSMEFCRGLEEEYELQQDPYSTRPGRIIKAIFGLDVLAGYFACDSCGYAYEEEKTVRRHIKGSDGCQKYQTRFAQVFRATLKRMYFAVEVDQAEEEDEDPLDPVFYLKKKFEPIPFSSMPIKSPGASQDANHFIRLERWDLYVQGKTGEEIVQAVREREPELREEVRTCVERFTQRVLDKLAAVDNESRKAIGDYQG